MNLFLHCLFRDIGFILIISFIAMWLFEENFFRTPQQNFIFHICVFFIATLLIWKIESICYLYRKNFHNEETKIEFITKNTRFQSDEYARVFAAIILKYDLYHLAKTMFNKQLKCWFLLFIFLLFEVFFSSSWVNREDYSLVWQPQWVDSVVEWFKSQTHTSNDRNNGWFAVYLHHGSLLTEYVKSEEDLLNSNLSIAGYLFHFFRLLTAIPTFICFYILFWKGIAEEVKNTFPHMVRSGKRMLWSIFVTLLLGLPFLLSPWIYMFPIYSFNPVYSSAYWIESLPYIFISYLAFLFSLQLMISWFLLFKRLFCKLFSFLK